MGILCQRKADPNDRSFENISANEKTGSAHWEVSMFFPKQAEVFIIKLMQNSNLKMERLLHTDSFDFWNWS